MDLKFHVPDYPSPVNELEVATVISTYPFHKKNYWKFMGYVDGSGVPYGLIIKYLSHESVIKKRIYGGEIWEIIGETDFIRNSANFMINEFSNPSGPLYLGMWD